MRKLVLLVHISLDGYVAFTKGELDKFPVGDDNLEFVCRLTDDADTALFGRISFELLNGYWPDRNKHSDATKSEIEFSNWYNNAEKIIFSKTLEEAALNNTRIISDHSADQIIDLKQQPGKDILIFGSPSISQLLMQMDLIDSYWIFVNPIIFGAGIPLFSGVTTTKKLKLIATKQLSNGEIALNYILDIPSHH